jgi:hypothetical protein
MECHADQNLVDCTCASATCPRRGKCCECVANHRAKGQLPGCLMPEPLRASSRSVEDFVAYHAQG